MAKPLYQLLTGENAKKKTNEVEWTEQCEQAFNKLKNICSDTPVLAYADYSKCFKVHTDTSEQGLGAVLYQDQDDGTTRVIAYASRNLSKSEKRYHSSKLEFLALKWSVCERFHEHLVCGKFQVYTDNNPLRYILITAKFDATGQWWVASLANYDFTFHYRSGKQNTEGDALSRIKWQHEDDVQVKAILARGSNADTTIPLGINSNKVHCSNMQVNNTPKLTQEDWVKEQCNDEDIGPVAELVQQGKHLQYICKEGDSSGMRVLLKYKQDLFIRNGLLYRKVKLKNHDSVINQFVTLALHDDYGHLGMVKTLGLLQEKFFWPKMIEDVRNHTGTCEQCTKCKQPPEREQLKPISCTYPLELVHLNFLTIRKEGTEKAINIMVITDHFTRYAQAYITPKQTAPVVAKTLWDKFLVHYGWPTKILMDQGKSFENQLIRELCSLAQVQKLRTTPYRPQTNGSCEHFNYTLMSMLGMLPIHARMGKHVDPCIQCHHVPHH